MKILELTLTAQEPLVITSGSAESMAHSCLDYVPGSMLLGAFAGAWIQRNPGKPDASPVFRRLFLNGEISWGCAFPLCGTEQSVPVPLCYMREKSLGGLPVYGLAFQADKFALFNPLALPDDESEEGLRKLWERITGQRVRPPKFKKLAASFMSPRHLRQPDLHKVWHTRVALGEQRCALEGQLFGFSGLAAGTKLKATLYCRTPDAAADLQALACQLSQLRVGHARSAGCGLVDLACAFGEATPQQTESRQEHNIFLCSHYLPDPPWENPLENLLRQLEALSGQRPVAVKSFIAYQQIEGFCTHWQKPRDSRIALRQGSAIRLSFDSALRLPQSFELGGDFLEGYGRISVNPAFLESPLPEIPNLEIAAPKKAAPAPVDLSAPLWGILRRRAMGRQALSQALVWLQDECWQRFLRDAEKLAKPSASQLANLMHMNVVKFREMLEKSPGRQWKDAVAANPFGSGREHLHSIVEKLLQPEIFMIKFTAKPPLLPGPQASEREMDEFHSQSHMLFRRELVRAWAKNSRTRRKEGEL